MNALKIFGENFVNGDCGFTYSSGSATGLYLYDQKPATQWASVGSNDTTEESIAVIFKNWQGSEVSRTFDRVIILGHNLKTLAVDYWDSGATAWVEIAATVLSGLTAANTLIELVTPVSSSRVRIRATTTQAANAEKAIGELKFCQSIITGSQLWRSDLPRTDDQKSGSYRVGDGGLVFWREWAKFGASGTVYDVSQTDHDLLFPCLKTGLFYTVIFWDDFDLTECFEIALTGAPHHTLNRKTRLYEISLTMEER